MPRRPRRPQDQGDDLFSSDPGDIVAHQLAGRSWPSQERFPVNHARAHVRAVVTEDLRTSDAPLLIAGYSSIAALTELVAEWRRIRGDRPGSVRLLLGSEPFPSRRTYFGSAQEQFTEEVRGYWLEHGGQFAFQAR